MLQQPLIVQDEGTTIGAASILNFAGAGVTAALSGSGATVTIPGGGSPGGISGSVQTNNGAGGFNGISPVTGTFLGISAGAWAAVNTADFIGLGGGTVATTGIVRFQFYSGSQDLIRGRTAAGTQATILNQAGNALVFGQTTTGGWDMQIAARTLDVTSNFNTGFDSPAGTDLFQIDGGSGVNVGGGAGSYGSGVGVMAIKNAATLVTTNPTGGLVIWGAAGAGRARGSGGTVTTFAPADPHCKRCGSDHGWEWETEIIDEYTRICARCLVQALAALGIDVRSFSTTVRAEKP